MNQSIIKFIVDSLSAAIQVFLADPILSWVVYLSVLAVILWIFSAIWRR